MDMRVVFLNYSDLDTIRVTIVGNGMIITSQKRPKLFTARPYANGNKKLRRKNTYLYVIDPTNNNIIYIRNIRYLHVKLNCLSSLV